MDNIYDLILQLTERIGSLERSAEVERSEASRARSDMYRTEDELATLKTENAELRRENDRHFKELNRLKESSAFSEVQIKAIIDNEGTREAMGDLLEDIAGMRKIGTIKHVRRLMGWGSVGLKEGKALVDSTRRFG